MIVGDGMMPRLELVANDLCEAHAADRMLEDMGGRHLALAKFNGSEAGVGLRFIREALAFRMALAVNRTLQGGANDGATFDRLLGLMKATRCNIDLSAFEKRLDELRNGEAARKLRDCRNGFMAHTLIGELGSRGGMKSVPIGDLLYDLTGLYEDIHRAVTGAEGRVVDECLEKWRKRAWETGNALLGVADGDEDLDIGSA
jgi:hypothetical protein